MTGKDTVVIHKNKPSDSDSLSLKEVVIKVRFLYKYLLSKWRIFVIFSVLGAALGFAYSIIRKPLYDSVTTFVLESGDGNGGLSQYAGVASMVGIDLGGNSGGIFQGDNILELYKSRKMLQKALLSQINANSDSLLIDYYIDQKQLRDKWENKPQLVNLKFQADTGQAFSRLQDSVLTAIIKDINTNILTVTKPDKKLSIIQVEVKSENEIFSKVFNDQIVKTVNDFYVQTKSKKAAENLSILQRQTDSVRNVLNGAINATVAVNDATPNLNPARQILRVGGQRSQMNADANKAILSELIKNLELAKISLRKETPLIQVIDTPVYPLKVDKVGRLKGIVTGAFALVFLCALLLTASKILKSLIE